MKGFSLLLILIVSAKSGLFAQQSNAVLLREAESKLQKGSSLSQILTDKKYDALHPETSFREMIKNYCKAETISIVTDTIPGRKIKVIGTVKTDNGKPAPGVTVYLYHTDSRGWYAVDKPHVGGNEGDRGHARLFGYVKTDKDGKFELHTIKPKGYPQSDLPAHIHIEISAPGYQPVVTEFLFDDDERLIDQIRQRAIQEGFIIAKPEKTISPFEQQFSYTLQLIKQ